MNWIGMIIGAVVGGSVYFLNLCQGGTCPITANWWIPVSVGAVLGLSWPVIRPVGQNDNSGDDESANGSGEANLDQEP